MPTQRYKLTLAYRGTRYHGWQKQLPANTWKGEIPEPGEGIPTIQEIVAKSLGGVVGHPVTLVGSSRTDAGVHAKGQVAHFDTDQTQIPPEGLRAAVNHRLPADILIRSVEPVSGEFDAIQCAVAKRYQYSIWNRADRNPFAPDLAWHRWQELDREAMKAGAGYFVGTQDFASFARPGHRRESTIRTVTDCGVSWRGGRVVIGVAGNGFLWNMIRIMVGTLVEVGLGRYPADEIAKMIAARDRRAAGATAPPEGLYLQWIVCGKEKLATDGAQIDTDKCK
ncbi:MAG TPA: tRNA pseudouridine(38-40) synthase TruA [Tepidisphaeraceae bacterium]|nr:tRNA pseudouridine(38-40) synthase TruA [Tepidisphaeraceae bacterium]